MCAKKRESGTVYVLQFPGTNQFKIGESGNFWQRYKIISNYLPVKPIIRQLFEVSNRFRGENFLHYHFAKKKINSEWYELNVEDLSWLLNENRTEWIENKIQQWRDGEARKRQNAFIRHEILMPEYFSFSRFALSVGFGSLSLAEKRVLIYLLYYSFAVGRPMQFNSVSVSDIITVFGQQSSFYHQIKNAVFSLNKKNVFLREYSNPLFKRNILYDDGYIHFSINPKVLPHLFSTSDSVKISLSEFTSFKSIHSIRLFELLKSLNSKEIEWDVEEFIKIMGLDGLYQLFGHLKNKVIQRAVTEINRNTTLNVSFSPVKYGRKYTSIQFKVEE